MSFANLLILGLLMPISVFSMFKYISNKQTQTKDFIQIKLPHTLRPLITGLKCQHPENEKLVISVSVKEVMPYLSFRSKKGQSLLGWLFNPQFEFDHFDEISYMRDLKQKVQLVIYSLPDDFMNSKTEHQAIIDTLTHKKIISQEG